MKPWLAAALLFLVAVPYHTYWPDYETARRGALALLVGLACFVPGSMPRQLPVVAWPAGLLAMWSVARSLSVSSTGYALEAASHLTALTVLVFVGTSMRRTSVLRAIMPTALCVALVAILQGLGFEMVMVPDTTAAVSTLGNLNVASEVLAIGGACAALLVCVPDSTHRDRALGFGVLLLCTIAIVWNGSRSGMLALPLGCLPVLLFRRRFLSLGALAVGFLVGVLTLSSSSPEKAQPQPAGPSTIDVRLELWTGTRDMIMAAPVLGHGGGQFQVEYPFYRTKSEIELSEYGNRFVTATKTAHNDYLQVVADYGAIGFLLAAFGFLVWLRRTRLDNLGPVFALLALACVRSPLGNAPAAAIVFLFAGTLISGETKRLEFGPRRHALQAGVIALFLVWFGASQLFGQLAATGYVHEVGTYRDLTKRETANWDRAMDSVEWALLFRPHDIDMRIQRAKDRLRQEATLPEARRDIEFLLRTAGQLPTVQIHHAELLNAEGDPQAALQVLNTLRARPQDADNRRAIQVSTVILVRNKNTPAAVQLLYTSKNPRTRERLASVLNGLAAEARTTKDKQLLRAESAFVSMIDQWLEYFARKDKLSAKQRLGVRLSIEREFKVFQKLQSALPKAATDLRFPVMLGLFTLEFDSRRNAAMIGAALSKQRALDPVHELLLEPLLPKLRELPEWREAL